jgi:hypothetical protein
MRLDCYCDYEQPDIYRSDIRKARKQYECEECSGFITAGEQYEYVFGVWDGHVSIFKTCERCLNIRQWVQNNVPCFCWAHGNMIGDASDAVNEAFWRAPEETVGLSFGFLRRKVALKKFNQARRTH